MGKCMATAIAVDLGTMAIKIGMGCILDILEQVIGPINNGCFPSDAEVVVQDGRAVQMRHLRVGDKVLTTGGRFSDVYVFSHEDPSEMWPFVQLETANGRVIQMTKHHFISVSKKCDGVVTNEYAGDVAVGTCVLSKTTLASNTESLVKVTGKSVVMKRGIFNPLVFDGQLFVNGVLVSSWASWFLDQAALS